MRSRYAVPFAALLLTFSASACASTGTQSLAGSAGNIPTALTSTADPGVDSTQVAVPDLPAGTTGATTAATSVPTTSAPAATTTTTTKAPAPRPTTTRPKPKPTTAAKPVATCMHHATIDEGTARCGAGESHPAGTTAECWDGSYSKSSTPSGTCSHHKGVEIWYY